MGRESVLCMVVRPRVADLCVPPSVAGGFCRSMASMFTVRNLTVQEATSMYPATTRGHYLLTECCCCWWQLFFIIINIIIIIITTTTQFSFQSVVSCSAHLVFLVPCLCSHSGTFGVPYPQHAYQHGVPWNHIQSRGYDKRNRIGDMVCSQMSCLVILACSPPRFLFFTWQCFNTRRSLFEHWLYATVEFTGHIQIYFLWENRRAKLKKNLMCTEYCYLKVIVWVKCDWWNLLSRHCSEAIFVSFSPYFAACFILCYSLQLLGSKSQSLKWARICNVFVVYKNKQ